MSEPSFLFNFFKYTIRIAHNFKQQLVGLLTLIIVFVGILSMYCAQQGFLQEAVYLLVVRAIADKFYRVQIEPELIGLPSFFKYARETFMGIVIDSIVFPATISFYFDCELFSPFHTVLLIFSVTESIGYFDRYMEYGMKTVDIPTRYKLFNLINYPVSSHIVLLVLFLDSWGRIGFDTQKNITIILLIIAITNFRVTFLLLKHIMGKHIDIIFRPVTLKKEISILAKFLNLVKSITKMKS